MIAPPISERDFMAQVTQLALIRGWSYLHIRPGMTRDSWRTPISGPLGKGWPDLLLVREKDQRHLAIELKRDGQKPTEDQLRVLGILAACGFETGWFTPSGWDELEGILK